MSTTEHICSKCGKAYLEYEIETDWVKCYRCGALHSYNSKYSVVFSKYEYPSLSRQNKITF